MSLESADAWRAWIAELAAADPRRRRFGARQHAYRVEEPLGDERVRAFEHACALRLPDDHRAFVTATSGGGAGPYHGLLPLDHPVQRRCAAGTFELTAAASLEEIDALTRDTEPARAAIDPVYAGVIGLGHVGCGYVALLVVRGEAAGQVWIDARDAGLGVGPIAPSFGAYVQDWIERTSRSEVPRPLVPPGVCALPATLSAYLARHESARGLAPGTIDARELREALAAIGPRAIAIETIADRPFFARGDRVDPCPSCAVLLENLRGRGLGPDALAPGLPPIPLRG